MGAAILTPLDTALADVTALGFDTVPFIYFIERHPAFVTMMREIFRRVHGGAILGYTSTITLTELLTKPYHEGNTTLARRYYALITRSRNLTLVPIDAPIADAAAELRARYSLRTPDALQIAAAITAGCDTFLTNDHALQRVADIRVLVLDTLAM
ncbi:MAG: type II toxin-antitoxin system VapC family toxin [Thermomicrobiales bacterium]